MIRLYRPLFIALQYALPQHLMTMLVHRVARIRTLAIKNALIRAYVSVFKVDLADVDAAVPRGYSSLAEFFSRPLAPGARPVDTAPNTLVSPVDGTVSAAGLVQRGQLLQAKGRTYSLQDLLATDLQDTRIYKNGSFATIYLAPYDYHRVHSPWQGRLIATRYVPGDLFSVNALTAAGVTNLFARNERLICHFVTDSGPMALILVGALNVGSITTPWTGEIRPQKRGMVEELDIYRNSTTTRVNKGDLLGWFNMGSTVILLAPPGACVLCDRLQAGARVRTGEPIATLQSVAP